MTHEQQPCPRCSTSGTVHLSGDGFLVCSSCHTRWLPDAEPAARPTSAADPGYPFTQKELTRLTIYRAAIEAGFYNEGHQRAAA